MGKFIQDNKGQLYTIEAVLAAGLLLGAVFFISASTPATVTPGQDFAKVQLKKYGQDVLMLFSYEDTNVAGGILDYTLYREWDDVKWEHDEGGESVEQGGAYWTTSYLHIDYDDDSEGLTVRFKLYDEKSGVWRDPSTVSGELKAVCYACEKSRFIISSATDSLEFEHEGRMLDYTISMAWYDDGAGGLSSCVLVWTDIKPEDRDDLLEIVAPALEGEEVLLQYKETGQGGFIDIWKDPDAKGNNWRVNGEKIGDIAGITKTDLGDDKFRFTFDDPAKGAYAITWGEGAAFAKHTHPVFVLVGPPGLVIGAIANPLEAVFREDLGYTLADLNDDLHSYIPKNIEFNLYFYDSEGALATSYEGEMKIENGNPTAEAVTVSLPVFASDGTTYDVYTAELVLWYK